jgi:hypothetical protein
MREFMAGAVAEQPLFPYSGAYWFRLQESPETLRRAAESGRLRTVAILLSKGMGVCVESLLRGTCEDVITGCLAAYRHTC